MSCRSCAKPGQAGRIRMSRLGREKPRRAGSLFVSVIVIQELEIGTLLIERRDPLQGSILRAWLEEHVLPTFAECTLSVDVAVARRSAALHVPDPRPIREL